MQENIEENIVLLAKWAFFFPRLGEYSNVGSESGKGKTTHLGICDIRSLWLQVLGFPHARPRMYRIDVGVAACILIEAHSHTLSSFRRIKLREKGGDPNFLIGKALQAGPNTRFALVGSKLN